MKNPSYLLLSRHSIYYFRWPIPLHMRQQGRAAQLKVSLETRDPKQALLLANALEYHARLITEHKSVLLMDHGDILNLLRDYFYELINEKKAEIHKHGPLSKNETQGLISLLDKTNRAIESDRDEIVPGEDMDVRLRPIIERYDVDMPMGSQDYNTLRARYKYAYKGYCEKVLSHNQKQLDFPFTTQPSYLAAVGFGDMVPKPENRLERVIEKYVAEMVKAEAWGIRAKEERESCFEYLKELVGQNYDVSRFDIVKARDVKEALQRTPSNRGKLREARDLPLAAQLRLEGVPTLSPGSINKYLQCFSSLFGWAVTNGYAEKNPFNKMNIKDKGKRRRDYFKAGHVELLLAEIDKGQSGLLDNDLRFWGVLIALYTGARLNEICSLTPNDIKHDTKNDIWYFDINDEEESKRLKTEAAIRQVPIHSEILRHGFLAYVESVREKAAADVRLLPGLTYSPKEGWGRKLGRWFNDTLLTKLCIKQPGLSFHSLRHTVITSLRSAGVDNHNVRALVGHEPDGVTEGVYNHGLELVQLKKDIERLSYSSE